MTGPDARRTKLTKKTLPLLFCSVAVLLAACGGGGSTSAVDDAAGGDQGVGAPAAGPAPAPQASTGWTVVARENESFSLSDARVVRYGASDSWVQRTVTGTATCSNAYFGADPVVGQVKRCEAPAGVATGSPAPAPATSPGVAPVASPSPSPSPAPAPAPAPAASPAPAAVPAPALGNALASARVMISGHSLTDDPLGSYMASIAQSLATSMAWNEQIVIGSPIRVRTRGENPSDPGFSGYRLGKNRDGAGLNVADELANPRTIGGQRFDTLVLAERHDLATTLIWEDTVRYARHYHDRLIAGNANANTYLYHAWLDVKNRDDASGWVAYEKAAAPAWQCVAARINTSLLAEGRVGRVTYLPAGLALASLVERATQGGVPGISGSSTRATIDQLFSDNVHMTTLGTYYMALVSYASIYRRSPEGAWAPPGVTSQQASSLQSVAWSSVSAHYSSARAPSMSECQSLMRERYCAAYGNYTGNGAMVSGCISHFSQPSQANPFHYDAANDASYWFPAPR